MAKESLYAPIKAPIFRETFADEQTTRALGGVPTSVTYSNGVGSFNGSSSYIKYINKNYSSATLFSVRIKMPSYTPATSVRNFADFRNNTGTGFGYIVDNTGNSLGISGGTSYINGVASSTLSTSTKEIVVTGMTLGAFEVFIGSRFSVSNFFSGTMELFEIYDYTLSANEVANLYANKRYEGMQYSSGVTEILNVDAKNGAIQNKWNSTVTNTATTVVRDGNIWAMDFSQTSSKIDCGSYDTLLGDKTLIMWVKPYYITSATGSFNAFSNGQFILQANFNGGEAFYFSRANFTGAYIFSTNSIKENVWQMIVVTSTSTGYSIMYKNATVIASATVTTPVAGTNITIGNGTSVGKPRVSGVRVIDGILTAQEISQLFSAERKNYNV